MRGGVSREVVRDLRTLYQFGVAGSIGDEQLLDRFLARRDEGAEEAFAELVRRHGPMVLGVCRRILGDAHEAEDAFQATFLVLARKAASVVRREKVASWLYGVAVRTAGEARVRAARRRAREDRVRTSIHVEPPDGELPDELRAILDEELARLPARDRGPVVLCELEGLSRTEAARRLGIPEGTLSSRLSRAKARLRDRLARRGVSLPAAALSALLLREARAVTVPLSLFESTVGAAAPVAAGPTAAAALSASVASLSEGVIQTMFLAKLKGIALAVGTMTAVVSGAVVLAQSGNQGPGPGGSLKTAEVRVEDGVIPGQVRPEPGPHGPPDRDNRAAALEKKLDRVLEALERLSRPGPPAANPRGSDVLLSADTLIVEPPPQSGARLPRRGPPRSNAPGSDVVPRPEAPSAEPPPQSGAMPPPPVDVRQEPEDSPRANLPAGPTTPSPVFHADVVDTRSLSDRLQAMEHQMQQVQQRLEGLERQLGELDARVGGGSGLHSVPRSSRPSVAQ